MQGSPSADNWRRTPFESSHVSPSCAAGNCHPLTEFPNRDGLQVQTTRKLERQIAQQMHRACTITTKFPLPTAGASFCDKKAQPGTSPQTSPVAFHPAPAWHAEMLVSPSRSTVRHHGKRSHASKRPVGAQIGILLLQNRAEGPLHRNNIPHHHDDQSLNDLLAHQRVGTRGQTRAKSH